MKKSQIAYDAWKSAVAAARLKADELQGFGDAVTAEQSAGLDVLLQQAAEAKSNYDRLLLLESQEEEVESRKTTNGRAPAVIPEGHLGQTKALSFANIWRASKAASGSGNREIYRQVAPEELEISDRLKAAGYFPVYGDSLLMPLSAELLTEPEDERHRKMADFTSLRNEIRERLTIKADVSEIAYWLKRSPDLAKSLGLRVKADMLIGDDSLGGFLIPAIQSGNIIDLLRAMSVLKRAGAMEIGLPPSGNLQYPRITSDVSFSYSDPDSSTDGSTTQLGTGVVKLQAKSNRGYVGLPNDLLRFSSPSAEAIVRAALAEKAALSSDNAGLEGTGSSLAPKGLINYTASTAETPTSGRITLHVAKTVAADGNTFEPEDVMKTQGLYWEGNDPQPATGWIMRPMLWAALANKRADAISAGDAKGPFMFPVDRGLMGNAPPTSLGGVPVFPTTQLSKNRSKGASTTLHCMVYGNFRRMIHGIVGVIEIASSEHVKFLQDKTIIRAILRDDWGVEHEESFVFVDTLVEG